MSAEWPPPATSGEVACSYCGALDGQPCTDRRGRPPIWCPGYEPLRRPVKDHYGARSIPFDPKVKP